MNKGDKVKVISMINFPHNGNYYAFQNIFVGDVLTLRDYMITKENGRYWLFEENDQNGCQTKWAFEFQFKLISNYNYKKMNIQEKFVLAFKSEPEKTFRKTGITNGDDILTDDGQKIFLSWLLKKNQDAFKKEVADDLLKDMEDEKNKVS